MVRRSPIEKKINHERWLVSYADFITLLFAFFVVMYSISAVNDTKYRELTETLGAAFASATKAENKNSPQTPSETNTEASPDTTPNATPNSTPELADLSDISDKLATGLAGDLDSGTASISTSEEWVEIELNANVLFKSGSAVLHNEAQSVLASVAALLQEYDNAVVVEGHTDNIPIANQEFSNNWALSAARAVSVVNSLTNNDVDPLRLSAVGMGEYRPLESNDSEEGRAKNRRVVLRVSRLATAETEAAIKEKAELESTQNNTNDFVNASNTEPETSSSAEDDGLEPVRLQGGGLLFSSDPDLPRTDPPLEDSEDGSSASEIVE